MALEPAPLRWRPRLHDVLAIVGLFAASRALLILAGMVGWGMQVPGQGWRGRDADGLSYALVPDNPMLDMWLRWDSWQYEEIARKGYWYDATHQPKPFGTVACFPLYPLAIRGVGRVLGGRYVVAGLLVSNLAAIVGFVLLYQWACWWGGREAAWVAVSAAIAFPAGLFWSALYPQSLMFALSVAACLLMLEGRVGWAALAGAAVTATRPEGMAILPALLAIQVRRRGRNIGRESLWLALTPLGLLAFMGYLAWRWGDPFLFLEVQSHFGRRPANPLRTLFEPLSDPGGGFTFRVRLTYVVGMVLIVGTISKPRGPLLLYGWLLFLIPLATGIYESIYRIHLINPGVYLSLALSLNGRLRPLAWALIVISGVFECSMMMAWVAGVWLP